MTKLAAYKKEQARIRKIVGKSEPNPRYSIIWGSLVRCYTGTTACSGLNSVAVATKKEAARRAKLIYNEVSDLILVVKLKSGKAIDL